MPDGKNQESRERTYIAIDLKSFYASVECVERELDPLNTNLVVADPTRTDKTICLAVSPGLKAYGVPGRPRLFEVIQQVKQINLRRKNAAPQKKFSQKSHFVSELSSDPSLELDYIVAPPRMSLYMKYSTDIYKIYLKYIAPEDIHVYSCDEVLMDVTAYLETYRMTARELAKKMIREVLASTGITAASGIGNNLFLCKVAMDIVAKHIPADEDGVRIAELNERSFREMLWNHTPLTDFWRIGRATERKLNQYGLRTLGDVARESENNEELFYRLFGINAELLIDHAWGWEPCTIDYIKQYRPENSSISSGQVLMRPYEYGEAGIVVREMADLLSLDLVSKRLVTDQIVLTVGYESLRAGEAVKDYSGELHVDRYGRSVPKHAHGTKNLSRRTASASLIVDAAMELYKETVDPGLMVRRITIAACKVVPESEAEQKPEYEQMNLFTDYNLQDPAGKEEEERLQKEKALQLAELQIRERFGRNAIIKGTSLQKGATGRERNAQIGGHRA
ncbi:MAG: DNA methylase [Lachnospiraceae bacterium]|nr:DNA methylase [Lachnospiraceae bacterium]